MKISPASSGFLFACPALVMMAAQARAEAPFVPAPAAEIPGYFAEVMPCRIESTEFTGTVRTNQRGEEMPVPVVKCKGDILSGKTLRELSILRNTIFARYGWDGYRKAWLRDHFHSQKWFRPNPHFRYKLLSEADRKNVHFIAVHEQSFSQRQLERMRADVYARSGKVWNDRPLWKTKKGKEVRACKPPERGAETDADLEHEPSNDCYYAEQPWYRPDPKWTEDRLTPADRIELGLISRAMGEFALDAEKRDQREASLDRLLKVEELRQLSMRDLRLLRNSIYARKGRPFKSPILRAHFQKMDWYKVNAQYSDALLSDNDRRNIALIKSVENEFGGPLKDEDFLIEPAVDVA